LAKTSIGIISLNAGELSPRLDARSDLSKYSAGCRILENFIPLPQGGAKRRPGTYFVHETVGSELCTNGNFTDGDTAWTGWAHNWASGTGKAVHTPGDDEPLTHLTMVTEAGHSYTVSVTISAMTVGTVYVKLGSTAAASITADGTYDYIITTVGTAGISFTPNNAFDGSIDDVSVRENQHGLRLIPFEFSTIQAYILEFFEHGIRIYKDNGVVETAPGSGVPVIVTTTYDADELFELKFAQSADYLYIVHKDHPPAQLTRTSHVAWTLSDIDFVYGKMSVITGITAANPPVVTAVAHGFSNDWWVRVDGVEGMVEINGVVAKVANKTADTFELAGVVGLGFTAYTGAGTTKREVFNGTSIKITAATAADPVEITAADHGLTDGDHVMITYVEGMVELNDIAYIVDNATADTFELKGIDGGAYTPYTSGGEVATTVFNRVGDYPNAIAFFEERLFFATGQTIWGSTSGDYYNFFSDSSVDDAAIIFTILSDKVDAIRWMLAQDYLMVGTLGGIWRCGASTKDESLTLGNIMVKRQSSIGCKDIDAELLNDTVMFVQRGGMNLRTVGYSFEKDKYVTSDLMIISDHIAKGSSLALSGITDVDYQQEPICILWAVRADGQLLGMVYEPDQQVYAWFRVVTDGKITSVAVIGEDDVEDQVWISVERIIDGDTRKYIEYFKPHEFWAQLPDCFFVDSGLTFDGSAPVPITDIDVSPTVDFTDTILLLHFNDNCVDYGGGANCPHTVTNVGVGYNDDGKFSKAALFTGAEYVTPNTEYMTVPDSPDWDFKAADFTIDCQIRVTDITTEVGNTIIAKRTTFGDASNSSFDVYVANNGRVWFEVYLFPAVAKQQYTAVNSITVDGLYHHIECVKASGIMKIYIDGVDGSQVSCDCGAGVMNTTTWPLSIGSYSFDTVRAYAFRGDIDELRISRVARHTTAFTPDTNPYANGSNIVLVTAASHGFSDGDDILIEDVVGTTEVNDNIYAVDNAATDTFELSGVDGSTFTAYISGGTVKQVENTFDNLDHLEGKTVSVLIDGTVHPDVVVSGGIAALNRYGNKIHVGLPYTSTVQPMRIDQGGSEGSTHARTKRISELTVRFYQTIGATWGPSETVQDDVPFGTGGPPVLFTGDMNYPFSGDYNLDASVVIMEEKPLPCTILGIFPKLAVYG
jgi:hypothetical protein